MSQSITPLSLINKDRIDWKIEVRVCRKWKSPSSGRTNESLEFLFVDVQGSRIQASVKKAFIPRFQDKLNEGDIFTVVQFSVLERPKSFPVADHNYRIMFHASTFVEKSSSSEFPKSIFQFKPFLDIFDGSQKDDGPLFDVIGTLLDVNDARMQIDPSVKGNKSIEIRLQDIESHDLKCVLWEPYCFKLKEFLDSTRDLKDPHVIIIQLCRSKGFRGQIQVTNTYHATNVIFDQNIDEIREFKSRLPMKSVSNSFDGSKISSSSFKNVHAELQSPNTVFLTLHDMQSTDLPVKCWVVASISEILYEKGWSYISCMKCKKKVKEHKSQFYCETCKGYVVGEERFKIHINVVDGTYNATLLLWNEISMSLVDKSADAVWEQVIQDFGKIEDAEINLRDALKNEVPQDIDALIGEEYLFKINVEDKHIQGYDAVYVVEKFCNDPEIIKKHKKTNHDVISLSSAKFKDVVSETMSVEEETTSSPSNAAFITPEAFKLGKRSMLNSPQDADRSTTKMSKSK